MFSLNDSVARMRGEWHANQRLRIGALGIALILLFSLLQALDDWREGQMLSAGVAMQEANDLKLVASQGEWVERAESAVSAHASLRRRLWLVASEGAAQAAIRDLMQAEARAAGLKIQRVTVSNVPTGRDQSVAVVRAEVEGEYRPLAWQRFVLGIETHNPTVIIESDRIDRSNPPRERYRLNVTAWYQLDVVGEKK